MFEGYVKFSLNYTEISHVFKKMFVLVQLKTEQPKNGMHNDGLLTTGVIISIEKE